MCTDRRTGLEYKPWASAQHGASPLSIGCSTCAYAGKHAGNGARAPLPRCKHSTLPDRMHAYTHSPLTTPSTASTLAPHPPPHAIALCGARYTQCRGRHALGAPACTSLRTADRGRYLVPASALEHTPAPSRACLCQKSTIPDIDKGKARRGEQEGVPKGHMTFGDRTRSCILG